MWNSNSPLPVVRAVISVQERHGMKARGSISLRVVFFSSAEKTDGRRETDRIWDNLITGGAHALQQRVAKERDKEKGGPRSVGKWNAEKRRGRSVDGLAPVWTEGSQMSGVLALAARHWSNSGWSFNQVKLFARLFVSLWLNFAQINYLTEQSGPRTPTRIQEWSNGLTLLFTAPKMCCYSCLIIRGFFAIKETIKLYNFFIDSFILLHPKTYDNSGHCLY